MVMWLVCGDRMCALLHAQSTIPSNTLRAKVAASMFLVEMMRRRFTGLDRAKGKRCRGQIDVRIDNKSR